MVLPSRERQAHPFAGQDLIARDERPPKDSSMNTGTSLPHNDLNHAQEPRPRGRERTASAILLGGVVAGTLNIAVACFINHVSPHTVLTFIASGLIGKTAFTEGGAAVALGLALQWAMSLIIAGIADVPSRGV